MIADVEGMSSALPVPITRHPIMLRLIDYRCCRNVKRSSGSYNEAFNYVDITTNNLRCCVGSNPAPKEYRFMGLVVVDTSVAIRNRG